MALGARIFRRNLLDHIKELQSDDSLKELIFAAFETDVDNRGSVGCGNVTDEGVYNISSERKQTDSHAVIVIPVTELAIGEDLSAVKGSFKRTDNVDSAETKSLTELVTTLLAENRSLRGGK